jgi:hypothetical protein
MPFMERQFLIASIEVELEVEAEEIKKIKEQKNGR